MHGRENSPTGEGQQWTCSFCNTGDAHPLKHATLPPSIQVPSFAARVDVRVVPRELALRVAAAVEERHSE